MPSREREDDVPPQSGENEGGESHPPPREQPARKPCRRAKRERPPDEGGQPDREDRGSEGREAPAQEAQVQHSDHFVGVRASVGNGPDRVGEIAGSPRKRERRRDEIDLVFQKRDRKRLRRPPPHREADGDCDDRQRERDPVGERQRHGRGAQKPGSRQDPEPSRGDGAGRRGGGNQTESESEPRPRPPGVRVDQQAGPKKPGEIDGRHEGRRDADEDGRAGSRVGASPRAAHFWKKRNRLTAEGPSEKKSPERSGAAHTSSDTPASSSGTGIASPFKYVPQVERRSTNR